MSTTSRGHVCRVFVAMIQKGPMTVDDLAASAEIGIDAARKWVAAMHAAQLVKPDGSARRGRSGPASLLWRWHG